MLNATLGTLAGRARRRLGRAWTQARHARAVHVVAGHANFGRCSICEARTLFIERGSWLRDEYACARCGSIPRQRALLHVLRVEFPNWPPLRIHESSPGGPSSEKLRRDCRGYVGSHLWTDLPLGAKRDGMRCEDLERLTFADESFDLCITQDVMEHVLDPAAALREIARTLKPGGAHVFTVPIHSRPTTLVRARRGAQGIEHLLPPDYHGNPIDAAGSLVVREWGRDLPELIHAHCGLSTTVHVIRDRTLGLDGEFLEVCVTRKPERVNPHGGPDPRRSCDR